MHGIDVSNNNGTVDWPTVHKSGHDFAICKVSEGTTFTDAFYTRNIRACRAVGIRACGYHYATRGTTAVQQARYFVERADIRPGDLCAGIIDMETADNGLEPDFAFALAWADEVSHGGRNGRCMLYGSDSFIHAAIQKNPNAWHDFSARHGLFVAAWGDTPPTLPYAVWQYRGGGAPMPGSCPGVHGVCDLDAWNPAVPLDRFMVPHPAQPWTVTIENGPNRGKVIGRANSIARANAQRRVWSMRHRRAWKAVRHLKYER